MSAPFHMKLYRRSMLGLMQSKIYNDVLLDIIPYIRFTTYYPEFSGIQYHSGYHFLKPGHIILTVDEQKLTTKLIGGEFSHAALCVSKDNVWEFSEMTHENYRKSTFFEICKESTRVVIINCNDWDEEYKKEVIKKCKSLRGAKYDTGFDLGIKALYCSELVYQSDFERRMKVNLEDLAGLGREYLSPTGILAGKNMSLVWDSDWFKPHYDLLQKDALEMMGERFVLTAMT